MKLLIVISSILLFGFTTTNTIGDGMVYICNSNTATKYHLNKTCRGLNKCKSSVVKISLGDAKKEGKKLCGWED